MLKYKYAYDEKGNEVNILNVPLEGHLKRIFTCMGCGGQMLAAIGPKRMYFRHKSDEANCDKESYLHKLAKIRIKRKFDDKTRPFNIALSGPLECEQHCKMFSETECTVNGLYPFIDLHDYYDTCEEERSYDGFVADLLLTNSSKPNIPPVFIEVCVTHKCTEEKKESGNKIIELIVSSEEKIDSLVDKDWGMPYNVQRSEEGNKRNICFVGFYGFNYITKEKTELSNNMRRQIERFVIYPTGMFYRAKRACYLSKDRYNPLTVMEFNILSKSREPSLLEIAHYLKRVYRIDIKACSLCRYLLNSRCHQYPDKNEYFEFNALECPRFELRWLKAAHIPEKDLFKDDEVEIIVPYCK